MTEDVVRTVHITFLISVTWCNTLAHVGYNSLQTGNTESAEANGSNRILISCEKTPIVPVFRSCRNVQIRALAVPTSRLAMRTAQSISGIHAKHKLSIYPSLNGNPHTKYNKSCGVEVYRGRNLSCLSCHSCACVLAGEGFNSNNVIT